jgi:hypothetical protein
MDIIRDKITVEIFFSRSLDRVTPVTDEDARAYFEREQDNKFYGKTFGQMKGYIKKYLQNRMVERSNDEWVESQMQKVKVRLIN